MDYTLDNLNRVEIAHLHTNTAAYADIIIDFMRLAPFTTDRVGGAVARTNRTAGAGVFDDVV